MFALILREVDNLQLNHKDLQTSPSILAQVVIANLPKEPCNA